MFKEIFEQPDAIRETLRGRVDASRGVLLEYEIGPLEIFSSMKHVALVGCGTSRHSGLVGKFLIEHFARLQVDVDYASEFRDRDALLQSDTLFVAVADSRNAMDTLEAMHRARDSGAFALLICDANDAACARLADSALFTRTGPNPGVASTKTFTAQLVVFYLLGLFLANSRRAMTPEQIGLRLRLLNRIPEQMERALENAPAIQALAERFCESAHAVVLGQGINFPIALEGAFKLNQISCIRAEAYPSAEMKHPWMPAADKTGPLVVLVPQDNIHRKTMATMRDLKTSERLILAIGTEGDQEIGAVADYVVRIPEADVFSNPFLTVIPLQLFAYYVASMRGIDLASKPVKSATTA
jgi:glutamine---fructose-6-phosphate transaminase (isomerizing)